MPSSVGARPGPPPAIISIADREPFVTPPAPQRVRIDIQGAVQGVGFRPFVYRLATSEGLAGWVVNDVTGVAVEVEGSPASVDRFLGRLRAELPPLASVDSLVTAHIDAAGDTEFTIRSSGDTGTKTVAMLPDAATCAACLAEVDDPADRRHGYPFTNCTNCGPRFSIIADLPYDRPNTTMRRFAMCAACRGEYDDPADRRFHAQPNACPSCGPQLGYLARGPGGEWEEPARGPAALDAAAAAVAAGRVVAVKGLGGFHLVTDAGSSAAVGALRDRKQRPHKPLAVMAADLDQARQIVEVDAVAEALLTGVAAPIVLLPRREGSGVVPDVAPDNPTLGVMLPYTPLHHLLLDAVGGPVVATSGNLTDEPIATDEQHALGYLGHIADEFLVHDRPIQRHVDDSVATVVDGRPQLLRRARGYAPAPVALPGDGPTVLAVGAHLKNTVALAVGRRAYLSQHIGDLETAEAMAAFERVIADFLRVYDAEPGLVAHDAHPDYLSTGWAKAGGWADRLVAVQHHHAHLAACLADNGLMGPALGVTWDGTGYGADGTIWGGEFLLGGPAESARVAHLRRFPLPGGDAAVKEPRRVALGMLWELYGAAAFDLDVAPLRLLDSEERRVLGAMLAGGLNAPLTSSAGRLFDGVAALLGLRQTVTFEAHAAMDLEFAADPAEAGAYPLPVAAGEPLVLDWGPLVEALLADVAAGIDAGVIAGRFHNSLARAIVAVAETVGEERVALTGGCFQNRLLTTKAAAALRAAGFEVLLHRAVPPNDGGISLGQAATARARHPER